MQTRILLVIITLFFLNQNIIKGENQPEVINKIVSFGKKKAPGKKNDVIIVHSVYNASGGDPYDVDLIIRQFSRYGVCAHYLIDREGKIYRMVDEQDIAYHAGVSKLPDGSTGINSRSIGIEIITSQTEAPTEAQMIAATQLVKDIRSRHNVKYVLRHSDIAPERKTDPWNMDWETFLDLIKDTK
ncbi:MAG: N-acetylmuramoyl-L-alanine amidase [Paludibacter sp.]|nr:N-acetylmuramoyl-L-alanine amidase [Paludibacter sp.]